MWFEKPVVKESNMELGMYTFVDLPGAGGGLTPLQRTRNLIEQAELADQVGLDVFGVGEHHRPEYVSSAPAVLLAAIAARTSNLRLTSAVTVLSSDDPVRVIQQFSSLDLVSGGRAEIMAGRGSFIESFPLFGYDLNDYNELFAEKLELLIALRDSERVDWHGQHRAGLSGQGVYPRPVQDSLPIWIAVGGTASSAARAGHLGLPMALAILGGATPRFAPIVEHYRQAAERSGHDPGSLRLGINTQGFVADTSSRAREDHYEPYARVMAQIARERGFSQPNPGDYQLSTELEGALAVGSPEEVAEKILFQHEIFGHDRYLMQMDLGATPHDKVMRSIELLGTRVAPIVREHLARGTTPPHEGHSIAL
jgi:probable LLM family oxidoreductase